MNRPLCEHCHDRPAKPRRRFCDVCYKAGVRRHFRAGFEASPNTPFCQVCDLRRVKLGGNGKHQRCCSHCYRTGAAQRPATIPPIDRPKNLADTGLRVDDSRGLLFHPDGRVTICPPSLVFDYFFESLSEEDDRQGKPLVLRVLRPAKEITHV